MKTSFSYYKFFLLIFLFFLLDQITKYAAKSFLTEAQVIVLIPYLLELFYIENTGISWGIFANIPEQARFWVLSVFPLFLVLGIFYYTLSSRNFHKFLWFQKLGWALILGGALGNLYDRFFFQAVTDFMHFRFFTTSLFINNLADDFISIGFCFILWKDVWQFFKTIKKNKQ